jgi:hypoxanthine-DNA glycosylase
MTKLTGFSPIASKSAKVLILGSMPSETSLLKQQYYGHPRNAFWPIMGVLFAALPELAYDQRKAILVRKGIAVWDVLKTCKRPGSMDSDIEMASIEINDFASFFASQPLLKHVFFNGGKAENVYKKYIEPELSTCFEYIDYQRLPSTSPAYASMNLQQKITAWQVVRQAVFKNEE